MILKEYLLNKGFKDKLPYQFHSDSYMVVHLEEDSYDFEIWSITNKRFSQVVFRGRIRSVEEFERIFSLVKEDYDLSTEELDKLNNPRSI